jgi:molybdopterin-guanine dinucleotide biosynthesis protein MobB
LKIFAIVGRSNSGKTRLILRLISELKSRGFSVGIVKHCGHSFSLDHAGKDSWKFMQSGTEGVVLVSPDRLAVIKRHDEQMGLSQAAKEFFPDTDFVLVEGGRKDRSLKKIEILNDEASGEIQSPADELVAVVSGQKMQTNKPEFSLDQIKEIVDFLEKYQE